MRSSELRLTDYDTDKVTSRYLEMYDPFFEHLLDKNVILLELGIYKGGSLQLWRDYFPHGTIVGIDINLPNDFIPGERISIYKGSQADINFLTSLSNESAPNGYDIIIDDASHIGALTKIAFWHLFDHHLMPGGLYIIEDWGTGYWDDWDDGKSLDLDSYLQSKSSPGRIFKYFSKIANLLSIKPQKLPMKSNTHGMVGFIKQLVDEQGAADASKRKRSLPSTRRSKLESMTIMPSLVFIKKAQ